MGIWQRDNGLRSKMDIVIICESIVTHRITQNTGWPSSTGLLKIGSPLGGKRKMTKDREVNSFAVESRFDKKKKNGLTGSPWALKGRCKPGKNAGCCDSSCCGQIGSSLGTSNGGGPCCQRNLPPESYRKFLSLHSKISLKDRTGERSGIS